MRDTAEGKKKLFASIDFPNAATPGNVFGYDMPAPMSPALTGILCEASGVVQPPPGYFVANIYVKNFNIGDTITQSAITDAAEFTKSGVPSSGNPPLPWTAISAFRSAKRSPVTVAPYVANNQLGITAMFMNYPAMTSTKWMDAPYIVPYKGDVSTQQCAPGARAAEEGDAEAERQSKGAQHMVNAFADPGSSMAIGCRDCPPHAATNCQYDWLSFDGLSVNNQNGNLLHAETQPLQANTIAVYVRRVCWKTRPNSPHIIRRSHGQSGESGIFSFVPLRFPELPAHSIVIYQPTPTGFSHMVSSQCADHPDIISLDPNYSVYAIVNDRVFGCYPDNVGSFSLSIAILGEGKGGGCGCG